MENEGKNARGVQSIAEYNAPRGPRLSPRSHSPRLK